MTADFFFKRKGKGIQVTSQVLSVLQEVQEKSHRMMIQETKEEYEKGSKK